MRDGEKDGEVGSFALGLLAGFEVGNKLGRKDWDAEDIPVGT